MREIEIDLPAEADCAEFERAIDRAIADCGLTITMRNSLGKCPGSIHWHLKQGRMAGTLELTLWPRERRAWFSVQGRREAAWIDAKIHLLGEAICEF